MNRSITEGRKRLRARLAGIESGAECERWSDVLSAMHDEEATATDLAAARPHLRNCAGCRAVVRAMHEGTSSLGVLLPVGAAPVVAEPALDVAVGVERSAGFGARVYELLVGTAHERAVSGAVKVQALADAIGASKVTAVAASAAALAGGGVAVERAVDPSPPRTPAARAEARPDRSPAPPRRLDAATALAPVAVPSTPVTAPLSPTVTPPTPRERAESRRRAARLERRRAQARARAREERRAADFGPGTVVTPGAPSVASAGTVASAPAPSVAPAPAPGTVVVAPAPSGSSGGPGATVAPSSGGGGDLLP